MAKRGKTIFLGQGLQPSPHFICIAGKKGLYWNHPGGSKSLSDQNTRPNPPIKSLREALKRFFFPHQTPYLIIPVGENPHLWRARERILTSMIRIGAAVGALILFFALPLFISYQQIEVALVYTSAVLAMWVLALWPRLRHTYKAMLFLFIFFFLGLSELINYGYSIEGYIYMLVFIISSIIFRGRQMGILAFLVSVACIVTIGLMIINHNFAPLSLEPEKINYSLDGWLVSWLVFILMGILVGNSSSQILDNLDHAWRLEMKAMRQLQEERDQLEQRVQERTHDLATARDQAISASRYKSELMARVNHELRTPLGAILGYSELLQSGTLGPTNEQQDKALAAVMESTNHLTGLINDLLDQSSIESGSIELNIHPFAIQNLRDHALGFKARAANKNLHFDVQTDPALPLVIFGDEKRMRQVLNNLINNALKFTEQGEVQVRLACSDADHWLIEVCDTGPGIPLEAQPHVFEPFWQLDTSITRTKEGYGMGLAIVKQITDLLGGQVSLQSEPGQGCTFRVSLPLRTPSEEIVLPEAD